MKIRVENLKFSYNQNQVLNIGSINFESGKIYGIVGKNGVGKTTFFKALTNIIVNYTGSVIIDDIDIKQDLSPLAGVGIVLDDMELYKHQTGMFNLKFFGGLRGGFNQEQAMRLASQLEIATAINNKVSTYSLGMYKKLILLISLMNDAQTLIFDEPFRGLDTKSVNWFKNYLLDLKSEGRTILISSHIQEDIESLSDIVLVMENGDFNHKFDMTSDAIQYIYTVEVSDKSAFIAILTENNINFDDQTKSIKFEAHQEHYLKLFNKAVSQGIEFYQIKKENKFVTLIK
jgi:ABC-2 type transport system ATP-binding protein